MIEGDPEPPGDGERFYAYVPTLAGRLLSTTGWVVGWFAYGLAKAGFREAAERTADRAVTLQRHSKGAVRTFGHLAGRRGRLAGYRGELIVEGREVHGSFAGKGFFATYVVAAYNEQRALELIRRFERNADPASLRIDSGALDEPDPGAEGVLHVRPGRSFYSE